MDIVTKNKDIQAAEGEVSIGHRMDNMSLNPRLDTGLVDRPQWTLGQILGVKRLVDTIQVTNASTGLLYAFSNTPYNVIALFGFPISNYFAYMRYNVVFELEVQSAMQHQGAIIVNVIPNGLILAETHRMVGLGTTQFSAGGDIVTNRTILPHDFITFGHNGNYKIVLPWTCNRNMLPTARTALDSTIATQLIHYQLNVLQILMYDQLNHVASAVGTASIRIWAHLENVKFSGYKPNY